MQFYLCEEYTYPPGSEAVDPDIENCQVLGFAKVDNTDEAFSALLKDNAYLLDTRFGEVVGMELKNEDYRRRRSYFRLGAG